MACMDARPTWQSEPGSYLLVLALGETTCISAGSLGAYILARGRYVYAGSALGPGGVAGRVNRHLRAGKRLHWHVDYVTAAAAVTAIGAVYGTERRECAWVQALAALPGVTIPVPGFGSSDCRASCPAHLVRLPDDFPLSWIENELTRCPIQTI